MRPGVEIVSRDLPPPVSAPVDTGVWFVVGATATVPAQPVEITSMTQYEAVLGARTGVGVLLYDAVETYFREGGGKVWVSATAAAPTGATAATALGKLTKGLGPGQVSAPGMTDAAIHTALLDHAKACNRIAVLDGSETGAASAQTAFATAAKSSPNARYGGLFAPWVSIPGLASGTARVCPASAVMAGMMARNDLLHGPNVPAAGANGQSWAALDVTMKYTDQEYTALNDAGVDALKLLWSGVQAYGYRTVADQATDSGKIWRELSGARLNMAICAQAEQVGERYVFSQLDGRGLKIAEFGGELRSMLVPFYESGQLYGSSPDDAFRVDVGAQVNTPESIADGELHAVITVKMSPFSEWVKIEIVKVRTTETLAVAA